MEKYIKSLRKQLIHHNYLYYVLNDPQISDYKYDEMMEELMKLETQHPEFYDENSPTIKVGSDNAEDYPDEIK